MGLIVKVLRAPATGDCTNGGMSSKYDEITLTNVDGPFEPTETAPAARLEEGYVRGTAVIVYADNYEHGEHTMFGGNYAATSDSRFSDAVEKIVGFRLYGAIPIHDRVE